MEFDFLVNLFIFASKTRSISNLCFWDGGCSGHRPFFYFKAVFGAFPGPGGTSYCPFRKSVLNRIFAKINFFRKNYIKTFWKLNFLLYPCTRVEVTTRRPGPVPGTNNNSYGNVEIHHQGNQPQLQNQGYRAL